MCQRSLKLKLWTDCLYNPGRVTFSDVALFPPISHLDALADFSLLGESDLLSVTRESISAQIRLVALAYAGAISAAISRYLFAIFCILFFNNGCKFKRCWPRYRVAIFSAPGVVVVVVVVAGEPFCQR